MADAYQMLTRDEVSEGGRRRRAREMCAWTDGSCVSHSSAASLPLSGFDEPWLKRREVLQSDENSHWNATSGFCVAFPYV